MLRNLQSAIPTFDPILTSLPNMSTFNVTWVTFERLFQASLFSGTQNFAGFVRPFSISGITLQGQDNIYVMVQNLDTRVSTQSCMTTVAASMRAVAR